MRKISDALREIVRANPLLQVGLQHRLLNLSQVVKFLRPQIAALTRKEVKDSAVLMNLSRLQRNFVPDRKPWDLDIQVENITVHSDLVVASYAKTKQLHREVNALHNRLQKLEGYVTITEGTREILVIVERRNEDLVRQLISEKPFRENRNVASIGIVYSKDYIDVPGLYYFLFQQLFFQNINIIEIASTATELIFYLDQDEVRLAFDTFFHRFGKRSSPPAAA